MILLPEFNIRAFYSVRWLVRAEDASVSLTARFRCRRRQARVQTDMLRPSLIDNVEGRFCSPAEAAEAGRGYNRPNAALAGLGAQAQSHFLRP